MTEESQRLLQTAPAATGYGSLAGSDDNDGDSPSPPVVNPHRVLKRRILRWGKVKPRPMEEFLPIEGEEPDEVEAKKPHFSAKQMEVQKMALFFLVDWLITYFRWDSVADNNVFDRPDTFQPGDVVTFFHENPGVPALIMFAVIMAAAYQCYLEYQKHKNIVWNSDPKNLFTELGLKDLYQDEAQPEVEKLNRYLQEIIAKKNALIAEFNQKIRDEAALIADKNLKKAKLKEIKPRFDEKYPELKIHLKQGQVSLYYNKEKEEESPPLSLWEKIKNDPLTQTKKGLTKTSDWLKTLITWPGLWFWLIFMVSFMFTANIQALYPGLHSWAGSLAVLAIPLFLTSLVFLWKGYNKWRDKHPTNKKLMGATDDDTEQEEMLDLMRSIINKEKFDKQKIIGVENTAEIIGNQIAVSVNSDRQYNIELPQEIDQEYRERPKPSDHLIRLKATNCNNAGKKIMTFGATTAFIYAMLQFSVPNYAFTVVTTYDKKDGIKDLLTDKELTAIAAAMMVLAVLYGLHALYERNNEINKIAKQVDQALKLRSDRGKTLIDEMDENDAILRKLLTKEKQLNALLIKQNKTPPAYKAVPDYFESVSFDDVRRTGPSKNRKRNKFVARFFVVTGAIQSFVTLARVNLADGTGLVAGADIYTFPGMGISDSWEFSDAFLLTIGLGGFLWGAMRLWKYNQEHQEAEDLKFCQKLPERAIVLEDQIKHYRDRVVQLQNLLDSEAVVAVAVEERPEAPRAPYAAMRTESSSGSPDRGDSTDEPRVLPVVQHVESAVADDKNDQFTGERTPPPRSSSAPADLSPSRRVSAPVSYPPDLQISAVASQPNLRKTPDSGDSKVLPTVSSRSSNLSTSTTNFSSTSSLSLFATLSTSRESSLDRVAPAGSNSSSSASYTSLSPAALAGRSLSRGVSNPGSSPSPVVASANGQQAGFDGADLAADSSVAYVT